MEALPIIRPNFVCNLISIKNFAHICFDIFFVFVFDTNSLVGIIWVVNIIDERHKRFCITQK